MHLTQTPLHDASGIYGVIMASYIDKDRFGIEEARTGIVAEVKIWSARMASTSNYAICPYERNCIPLCHNILSRVTRSFLPRLLRKGLGTGLRGV